VTIVMIKVEVCMRRVTWAVSIGKIKPKPIFEIFLSSFLICIFAIKLPRCIATKPLIHSLGLEVR